MPTWYTKAAVDALLAQKADAARIGTVTKVTLIGTAQAVTLPASPGMGDTASVILTQDATGGRTASWPASVVWDAGTAPTLSTGAGARDVLTFLWTGDDWLGFVSGAFAALPAAPDTTAPTAPTGLTATATSSTTVDLSWTASTDAVGVTGYEHRIDGGAATGTGTGTTRTVTGLTASTAYTFEVRAFDAAGNRSAWSASASATTSAPAGDTTPPTAGTLAGSAITSSGFTLTVTGAADETALHATPYAFSTDNGGTWSAYQAGATYNATGLTASTAYTCRHRVRDAAGNVSTGTGITVTTSAPSVTPASDDFNRADGALGTTPVGGLTWGSYSTNAFTIVTNQAKSNVPSENCLSFVDFGQADMKVGCKVMVLAKASGPALRVAPDGTAFYRVVYISGTMYIVVHTAWATAPTIDSWAQALTAGDTIEVTAVNSGADVVLTVSRNGTVVRTFTDSVYKLNGTRAGIWGVNTAIVDDFTVALP